MHITYYILSVLDTKLYYLHQQLTVLLSLKLNDITPLTFIILFIAGILTSLNPCLISIFPVSVSYLYGSSSTIKVINKIMFLIGIATSLIIMIFIASILNQQSHDLLNKIPILSSILTIFLGLNFLQVINIADFLPKLSQAYSSSSIKILQDYTIGVVLGLSSAPCSTPITLTILAWLLNTKYLTLGYLYLLVYCLGYIVPLVLFLNWAFSYRQISTMIQSWYYLVPISGSLILGFGIFSFLEKIFI